MINKEDIQEFFAREFPHSPVVVEEIGDRKACIRGTVDADALRPGGTVSGPFMMAMADIALYVAILGELGLVALAVTTSLNINFLQLTLVTRINRPYQLS